MNEYSHAAEQFKEEIIERFLKDHPGLTRADIHAEILNGRVVVKKKPRTRLSSPKQAEEKKRSVEDRKILFKLSEQDKHYRSAQNSIRATRSLLESLYSCPYIQFSSENRQEHLDEIREKEEQLQDHSLEMFAVKEKYQEYMNNTRRPLPSLQHTMKMELMNALLAQLMTLADIFNYEVKLGGLFGSMVQDFFRRNIDKMKDAEEKILDYIGKSMRFLKMEEPRGVIYNENSDVKALQSALERLDRTLSHRRKQIEQVQRLIIVVSGYLDTVTTNVDDLEISRKIKRPTRMVFSSKGRRGP